jgi:sugar porter (SP) family MFS transporter
MRHFMHPFTYVISISLIAAIGGILFGYDTAVISGTTEALQAHFQIGDFALGWVVSSALVGCVVGIPIAGWFTDKFGRKPALILSAILFTLSALGSAFPPDANFLIAARLLGGIGVGIASMIAPMYIAEIAPPKHRGALVSMNQIAIVSGMVIAYFANRSIVDWGDASWMNTFGWRWMFGMEVGPALLFFLLTLTIPESPRWLAKQGRFDQSRAIISRIALPEQAAPAYGAILKSLEEEEGQMGELFRPGARCITYMTMVLALFQAITGINIVMYYAPRIFINAGIRSGDAYGHSIIIGSVMILFTFVSLFLVDRFGRRPLMISASAGMGISLLLMGIAFPHAEERGLLLLGCTLGYVAWFSVGMGGIYWVVVSEIFPNRVRGRAMALSVIFLWLGNFLVAQFFPVMLSTLKGGVFYVFAASCLLCLGFIARYLPETRGRSLEELGDEFFLHVKQ